MKQLQKDLQSTAKTLNSLVKKIDAISKKLVGFEKAKPAPKPRAKAVKETAVSKNVKKSAPKKAASAKNVPKKAKPETGSDAVLKIVGRYKKGVNTASLKEKTGFNAKKVQNIVFRLKKQGKIRTHVKGVYVKA